MSSNIIHGNLRIIYKNLSRACSSKIRHGQSLGCIFSYLSHDRPYCYEHTRHRKKPSLLGDRLLKDKSQVFQFNAW